MKALALSLLLSCILITPPTRPAHGAEPGSKEHPGAVALSQESNGAWRYRSFPQLTHLYVSQKDRRGAFACDEKCASAWPPLIASGHHTGQKVGLWTVVQRPDGKQQWAYKGQPVYLRYHDMPADPRTMEIEGFRPLQP